MLLLFHITSFIIEISINNLDALIPEIIIGGTVIAYLGRGESTIDLIYTVVFMPDGTLGYFNNKKIIKKKINKVLQVLSIKYNKYSTLFTKQKS